MKRKPTTRAQIETTLRSLKRAQELAERLRDSYPSDGSPSPSVDPLEPTTTAERPAA